MAAFASCRRSGWVRLLVVILCALFIFATIGAPPAHALAVESVAVFGLASVLSAATAALGFKLASNEQGQATLQKMVQDFKTVAWATGFILVGSKLNGLQNGMDYIKMQVQNGKTYLDSRVFAWVQQWLAENGVYSDDSETWPDYEAGTYLVIKQGNMTYQQVSSYFPAKAQEVFSKLISQYDLDLSHKVYQLSDTWYRYGEIFRIDVLSDSMIGKEAKIFASDKPYIGYGNGSGLILDAKTYEWRSLWPEDDFTVGDFSVSNPFYLKLTHGTYDNNAETWCSNVSDVVLTGNDTGLSGTDTLGKDVVDLTLDKILEKLKEWAQDWYDAGADSATNAATGAKDLPLTVATGAATANPSIAEDGPLVWFPPFSIPIPNLRTGETDTKTVDQGKENASAAETSTVDVAENQSVIDSLVNWALSYISPDTGLFSKFPLCVPYDVYLLVTSSLGVDAVGSDSIFGASPGDLEGVVSQDIDTYSDFQPIINIKHDFELDGVMYPLDITIDLTPWQPLVTFFREGMALLLVAELIGSEFKRIRGH